MSRLSDLSLACDGLTSIQRRGILLGLTVSSGLGLVASTIYVPSVPAIAQALHTSVGRVQFTFAAYLLAFAVGMLVLGPLSDRFGRRRTVLGGLGLGAVASLICAVSPTVEILIAARVLQGIGACAGFVVGRALTRELWGPSAAAQVIAGRAIATTLMQASAPVLGGLLQSWIGWRANFAVVAVLACFGIVLMVSFMPDRGADPRQPMGCLPILASYRALITTRCFIGYAFAAAGAHAGFHIFAAGGPAVLISKFGVAPEKYGLYAVLPPLGFLFGSFLSNRLTNRLGVNGMIAIGAMVLIPAGLLMLALAVLHISGPFIIIGPMIFVCCGSGLITPNAAAGSLGADPRTVGAAAGLGSFIQMTGAAGATAALSLGPGGSPVALAVIIAFAGLFCVASFGLLMPSRPVAAEAEARLPA